MSTCNAKNLVAHTIPLQGKHLIEASAGTGKTFNITRIYLRLLLEKRLTVEQILVMTFTKDATEEIRGRIDAFIRQSLNGWDELILTDDYYQSIATVIDANDAKILLKQALLYLDEASIFTIHGFCKRVLSQHAFTSGQPFSLAMESDCNDVVLESCQDWFRVLSQQSPDEFLLVTEFWGTPDALLNQFSKAINKTNALDLIDEQSVIERFANTVNQALDSLTNNHAALVEYLVDVKKGADRDKRLQELTDLVEWLRVLSENIEVTSADVTTSKIPDAFIDGKRYARSAHKPELLNIFEPVKQVKASYKTLNKDINRAKALSVVRDGIYHIRQDVTNKKNDRDLVSFDDLISRLAKQLSNEFVTPNTHHNNEQEVTSATLAQLLFKQFPVALVDEFQDTDPLQFDILKAVYYAQPDAALYMIGDPKQAIYGFRGGDIFTYLSARDGCDYQWIMDTNWRSSRSMIQGYNRLFYGNNLNEQARDVFKYNIDYVPVNASPNAHLKETSHAINNEHEQRSALQFIHFSAEDAGKKAVPQSYRKPMSQWCANEIVSLLNNKINTTIADTKRLNPQDIAILVRDGTEAADIKQALNNVGLACVYLSNRSNLLHSGQAQQIIQVLKGILFVEHDRYFTAALANDLFGFNAQKLHELQQDEFSWQNLKMTFFQLREDWEKKGFIGMALQLLHEHFVDVTVDKDRVLTNILHLFELLQSASQKHQQPQELLHWFEQQTQQSSPDVEAELRLESDENLIRIVTQHGAKGLEYPVVFVPFATRHKDPLKFGVSSLTLIEYHDDNDKLLLSLDGTAKAKQQMANEAYAEAVRLLYVAVTRAEQRCYILSTGFDKFEKSPLGQTLGWTADTDITQSINVLVADNPKEVSLLTIEEVDDVVLYKTHIEKHQDFSPEKFIGKIERDWWLSSFSALSRNLKHKGISTPDRDNDTELVDLSITTTNDDYSSSQLRFVMEKGARTGNLLHNILERVNFVEPDWDNAFEWPLSRYGDFTPGYSHDDLQHWLAQIIKTPFNTVTTVDTTETTLTLELLNNTRCIRESEFYFPMDAKHTRELTELLENHRQNDLENFTSAGIKHVQLPHYQKLKGMMHGFIDLVFEHNGKYYVCDYKSTYLGDNYEAYNAQAMREDIEHNHYDLQYLIYSLALHRYLSFALPDYNSSIHFGGIYYLYLRGMTDDVQYKGCGVYHRVISNDDLQTLDVIFEGEPANDK
jgi:exodeoxyribonuclease V beta subunit